ncbi:Beta-propeller repeat protein [uncultured archaeon]|nr:Beta-propeller repeat protein [uncultured archaeon]
MEFRNISSFFKKVLCYVCNIYLIFIFFITFISRNLMMHGKEEQAFYAKTWRKEETVLYWVPEIKWRKKMKKKIIGIIVCMLLIAICALPNIFADSNWLWVKQVGGTSWDTGYAICTDSSGNIYVTGFFTGTVSFGDFLLDAGGLTGIFVAKLDSTGTWLWAAQSTGFIEPPHIQGSDICVDSNDNVYVTGVFTETVTFGSYGPFVSHSGGEDVFVAKLDSGGTWVWATTAGGDSNDEGCGIGVNSNGDVYITGYFQTEAWFGSHYVSSIHSTIEAFVAKLDNSGTWLWVTQTMSLPDPYPGFARGSDISVDSNGDVYVIGYFSGAVGPMQFSTTDQDVFVAKLDSSGTWLWAAKSREGDRERGQGITLDSQGNVYVTGYCESDCYFDLFHIENGGLFVAKLDSSSHNWVWATGVAGDAEGYDIYVDSSDDVYVTGHMDGQNVFVAILDRSGALLWTAQPSGVENSVGYGVCGYSNNDFYITGWFCYTASFNNIVVTSNGEEDVFVAKVHYNLPPVADFTYTPDDPTSTSIIHFTDTSTDSDGTIVSWWWDFGDGYYSNLQNPIHCYYTNGEYMVTLTVTDNEDVKNTFTTSVTVQELTPTPVLSFAPSSHDFGVMTAGHTGSTSFDIWNSGAGTLTYSFSESSGWVTVTPTTGDSTGEHDTITVNIDTTGLSPGSYNCPVSVSSNGGSGMVTIDVTVIPTEVLDQQQTKYTNKYSFYGVNWLGQSFIPTATRLTHAEVYIGRTNTLSSDLVLSIRSSPTGPDQVIALKPAAEIPTTTNWVHFEFNDLTVIPGTTYYLILRTYAGDKLNYYYWGYGTNTPYTNGMMWVSNNAGFIWTSFLKYDFCFKTYGYT